MFFANHARTVTLIVRADSLEKSMSHYLIDQIRTKSNIRTALRSEVTAVYGETHLTALDILDRGTNEVRREESGGLFVFIGADAETAWLPPEIARDPRGYILTGGDVVKAGRWKESRDPYLVETSVPGVFACGDVRFSPVKRVASAVGEGSIAIAFVHQYLASAASAASARSAMSGTRKIAAILVADVVGYSRLASADEERTLARLRALLGDLIEPAIAAHHGRIVKRTGDGFIAEFRSVVDAARCAIEVQTGMIERNAGVAPDRRIEFRIGAHLGDVVEEADGDLMGDGVNIAARLEGICTAGAICMSEDFYRQLKGRLEAAVTDLGPKQLKNIAEPIRVYSLDVGQPTQAKTAPIPPPEKSSPPRLSIVVLPFANIGGDPEQEHFVDGVTESLTTDLSRLRSAVVIARNTAFTYKGKPFDVKTIGRELNVRYVLEGSVQRGGNRMRVNVQLVDAETGSHLWAERFDKPLADLFDMQDEIVGRLANTLSDQIAAVEARHAEQAPNPNSMDLFFQGLSWVHRGRTPNHVAQARAFFRSRA